MRPHNATRTIRCSCGVVHERRATSTWHNDQCDDCLTRWAYDKAVQDADKAITDGQSAHVIRWHSNNVESWRASMRERGLLPPR